MVKVVPHTNIYKQQEIIVSYAVQPHLSHLRLHKAHIFTMKFPLSQKKTWHRLHFPLASRHVAHLGEVNQ